MVRAGDSNNNDDDHRSESATVIRGDHGSEILSRRARPEAIVRAAAQWNVQVDKVDAGDVKFLAPSFRVAIYESLLEELSKTKRFKQVLRDGDRNADDVSDLLILKTTVQKYTPEARPSEL